MSHRDQHFGSVSYAQHGDDFMILNLANLLGLEKFTYLDIGANHPTNISNTALLYEKGWRGINVDADNTHANLFLEQRPEDVNIFGVAVVPTGHPPMIDLYLYWPGSGRNTCSEDELKRFQAEYPQTTVRNIKTIPTTTLDSIVKEYGGGIFPSLLSIDIEGLDFDVLASTDFSKSKPAILVIETRKKDTGKVLELATSKGFAGVCRMGENLFFVDCKLASKYMWGGENPF